MAVVDLVIEQGATWNWSATLSSKDDQSGVLTPIDLTGASAAMQIRKRVDAPTALVSLTSGGGITLGGAAGTIAMTLSAAATTALPAGTALYDFELTTASETRRLFSGQVTISPQVTR